LIPLCSPSSPPFETSQTISVWPGRSHAQFDQSVGQQNSIAALDLARQPPVACRNAGAGAHLSAGRDRELLSGAQLHGLAAFEQAGTNFRTLQIRHQSDRLLQFARG
jgi:hypothetical protein